MAGTIDRGGGAKTFFEKKLRGRRLFFEKKGADYFMKEGGEDLIFEKIRGR